MVTIQTNNEITCENRSLISTDKMENSNICSFNYYILNTARCKYDGEIDSTKPFLKLLSVTEIKKNKIINSYVGIFYFFIK